MTKQLLLSVIGLASANALGQSLQVDLSMSSLPSQQGWTYAALNGRDEVSVFSLQGGVLHQDTMGIWEFGPGSNRYDWYQFNPALPVTISVRARVLNAENMGWNNYYGFGVAVLTGTEQAALSIGPNLIQGVVTSTSTAEGLNIHPTSFDTSEFHDYRLEVTPGVGYSIFADNSLVLSSPAIPYDYATPFITFGDSTGGANAQGEIASLSVTQVPEPGSFAVVAGLGLAAWAMRRRK